MVLNLEVKLDPISTKYSLNCFAIIFSSNISYSPIKFFEEDSRSSRPGAFCKEDVLKNFTRNYQRATNFSKNRLQHRCFPVNFANFQENLF